MITTKPLNCPFCGKEPKIFPINPKEEGDAWGHVQCINKECWANPGVYDGITISDDRGSDKYKEAAIIRWNNRQI